MRFARFVTAAAVSAASLLCSAGTAHAVVDFKTPRNAVYCASDHFKGTTFTCWTPNDGFTVRMSTNGRVTKRYDADNRGNHDRYYGRILRYGQVGRFGADRRFRCVSRSSGLTCTNRRGHGWWLGVFVGYRVF